MTRYKLLDMEPKNRFLIILIFMIISIILITSYEVETYDSVSVTGLVTCEDKCQISLTLPYDKIEILNNNSFVYYNNKSYDIYEYIFEEPYLNGDMVYQDIKLTTNLTSTNPLVNIKILSNRERIITKIKNKILER